MVIVKLCFCILLLLFLLMVAAKASLKLFLLTGTVSGRNGQLVSLIQKSGEKSQVLCSLIIENNQFRLSCKVERKEEVILVFHQGKEKIIYPVVLREGHFNFSEEQFGKNNQKFKNEDIIHSYS